ncbi:hypothetical protein INT47_001222 [Mucor saturninus]|uniref:Uncharacterized protein n=1 Tax=Mucor saturninus TaxID=64648 RepID=A0A8H7VEX4_9FUNG|nr:hypothetical protein INT47_001222 [Mucor saturninus]
MYMYIYICIVGGLLIYRVAYKQMSIFDYSRSPRHFARPRPIESLLFFGTIFNFLRAIDAALIVTDALSNKIFRAFFYELPWQFGICAFTCYLYGIAHTVSHSSKVIQNNWFKSLILIDISCTAMLILPFISNNICSIAAAIYAERGDLVKAKIFTDTLYFFWTFYCFILASWIVFAGLRLLKILRHHLDNQHDPEGSTVHKIKNGLFKVKMIMSISVTSLLVFSFVKCIYGIFRVKLLLHSEFNLALACIWTFDGTLASMLVVVSLLITPKALSPLDSSSGELESSSQSDFSRGRLSNNTKGGFSRSRDTISKNGFRGREVLVPESPYHGEYPANFNQSGVSEAHLIPLSQDIKS